jgi:branched-chain amino acid transport system substrate-binding protein
MEGHGLRNRLAFIGTFLLTLPFLGVPAGAAPQPLLIGAVLSYSGPSAPLGVPQKNSLELAEQVINAHGGIAGRPVHFEIVDDEAKPDIAAQLAQQLIGKGAVAIICGTRTATSAAAVRVTSGANVVQFFSTPSAELWNSPRGVVKTVFQVAPTAGQEAMAGVQYLKDKQKVKSIAMLHDENEYGTGAAAATADAAKSLGVTVTANESYAGVATDFTPQLLRIKATKPDALLIIGATNTPALATVQARSLGLNVPVMGTSAILNPAFLRVVGNADGTLLSDTNFNFTYPDAASKTYIALYTQAYHAPAVIFGAMSYDTAFLLKKAIEKNGGKTDGPSLAATLESMGAYPGLLGTYRYTATDHNGLSATDVKIAQAHKGVWFTLK